MLIIEYKILFQQVILILIYFFGLFGVIVIEHFVKYLFVLVICLLNIM